MLKSYKLVLHECMHGLLCLFLVPLKLMLQIKYAKVQRLQEYISVFQQIKRVVNPRAISIHEDLFYLHQPRKMMVHATQTFATFTAERLLKLKNSGIFLFLYLKQDQRNFCHFLWQILTFLAVAGSGKGMKNASFWLRRSKACFRPILLKA